MNCSSIVLSLLFISVVICIGMLFDVHDILIHYQFLKLVVANYYWMALTGFFFFYFVAVALSLPTSSMLSLIGAAIFGWTVLPVIVFAATLGALCVFLLAKTVFQKVLTKKVDQYLPVMKSTFKETPIRWCLTMRLIPFVPFWAANILLAALGMSPTTFFVATLLGIIPGSIIYIGLGTSLDIIFIQGRDVDISTFVTPSIWWPLAALGLLTAISTRFKYRLNKEE